MLRHIDRLNLLVALVASTVCAALNGIVVADPLPRIEVSDNQRFLQTETGEPFFWLGDTAWMLMRLSPEELDVYFADRAAKGFNVIQGPYLFADDLFSVSTNYEGVGNPDFSVPNEGWMQHIDLIFDKAEDHGLYVVPLLAHGTHAAPFDLKTAYDWGFYVGDRYKDQTNFAAILVAGEFNFPDANIPIWEAMAQGLSDAMGDNLPLLSCHPRWFSGFEQSTSNDLHDEPWLDFNLIQSSLFGNCTNDPEVFAYEGTHNWIIIENDYQLAPTKPVIDGEATYEQQNPAHSECSFNPIRWTAFGCRRRAYWSVFAGGFGHTYGANGVFQFHKEDSPLTDWSPLDYWDVAIEYPGASQMLHLRNLIESRPFFTRIPGNDILLAGFDDDVPTHVHATRSSDGSYAMVYIPQAGHTVTVDLNLISGESVNAWWYNPKTGLATMIGQFASSGSADFTTPLRCEDYVLVLDDASQEFAPPGMIEEEPRLVTDLNGDGCVGQGDLGILLAAFGGSDVDLTGDGVAGQADLGILLAEFGEGDCN